MDSFIEPGEYMEEHERDPMPEPYREFRDRQDVPVHTGLYVPDLDDLETAPWEMTGQRGAFINLVGMEGVDDLQLHDIAPGGATEYQHHAYQEVVYVVEGAGSTVLGRGEDAIAFEWDANALFVLPRNTPYRHLNQSDDRSVRLVCQTDLPQMLALTEDEAFVFDNGYDYWDRIDPDAYEQGEAGTMYEHKYEGSAVPVTWEANLVPDVRQFDRLGTDQWSTLGAMRIIRFPFPLSNTHAHIGEIPVGQYKNAHRHGPGANVFGSAGQGYTLMWKPEWDVKIKLDWGPRSVFTPPAGWYHHHFNLGPEPAGQFAIHAPPLGTLKDFSVFDSHADENIIEYADEDPEIRELYERELERVGGEFRMPEACYEDPDYDFTG